VLDRLLIDAASDAGADVVYGVKVKALLRAEAGRVAGVVLEDESGHVHHVASRLVIGADGLHSTVARLADAPTYRTGRHAAATMYGHWPGLAVNGYEWYFAPRLSAGGIPTNSGEVCVFVAVPMAEFATLFADHESRDTTFQELLSRVAPDLAEQITESAPVALHGFAGHAGFFRQSYGPGWALVGDAGYFKDPLTSHGITDALRDAELLATAIDRGSDEALADYQAQRDALSTELFETTDEIASFSWDLNSVRVLHEALAKAMSREVKQMLAAPAPLATVAHMRSA